MLGCLPEYMGSIRVDNRELRDGKGIYQRAGLESIAG